MHIHYIEYRIADFCPIPAKTNRRPDPWWACRLGSQIAPYLIHFV